MNLQITITKDVLRRSMFCGTAQSDEFTSQGCAIALALKDIFNTVSVNQCDITIYGRFSGGIASWVQILPTPEKAIYFINKFDSLSHAPHDRLRLPEFSFTITLPPEVVDAVNIDDVYRSETLQIV